MQMILATTVLIVGLALGSAYGVETPDRNHDQEPAPPPAVGVQFSPATAIDPHTVDLKATDQAMRGCAIRGERTVKARIFSADPLNPLITVFSGSETIREFTPEPRVKLPVKGAGTGPKVACDGQGRFFVLHPYAGYIAAYDDSGSPIWSRQLPDFVKVESRMQNVQGDDLAAFLGAFDAGASTARQIRASGDYLAVEVFARGRGTEHYILHRSGMWIGRSAPWDGRILEPTESGWTFVSGGGADLRFYVPKFRWDVSVGDRGFESILDHALAWMLPRPMDKKLELHCLSREDEELRHWLGDRYAASAARAARNMIIRLGGDNWFAELLRRPRMTSVVSSFDPLSESWRLAYRQALLDSGFDIEIARAMGTDAPRLAARASPAPETQP